MMKKYFRVGEIIEESGFSRQVIHNYTQLRLIHETKRTPTGYRLYPEDVFNRLKRIKELKAKGKTLMEIKKMLNSKG